MKPCSYAGAFVLAAVAACGLRAADGLGALATMTRSDAAVARPCCVTGVVTFVLSWRNLSGLMASVEDPNGRAIYFSGEVLGRPTARLESLTNLVPGQVVEIKGVTSKMAFAPGVKADSIRGLGKIDLPTPPLVGVHDLDWGVRDNQRIRLRGVLLEARPGQGRSPADEGTFARLLLGTPEGVVVAHVLSPPEKWTPLVDAELELEGCAMSFFNLRAEFIGVQLEVAKAENIRVLRLPPPDPFAAPLVALDSVLSYSGRAPDGHRRRVLGTVTYVAPGSLFYLQQGDHAIRVRSGQVAAIEPGDRVEAVGFPAMEDNCGELRSSIYRRVGRGDQLEPAALSSMKLDEFPARPDSAFENFDGRLVRVKGRFVRADPPVAGWTEIQLAVEDRMVPLRLAGALSKELADANETRPMLSVTGVCHLTLESGLPTGRLPAIRSQEILLRSAGDLVILPDLAYEARRRSLTWDHVVVGVLAALALLGCVLFAKFLGWRRTHRRLRVVLAERKRMAGDLHDTIEQHLAGAGMLLRTSLAMGKDTPPAITRAVEAAAEILVHAKTEIRATIWDLRSDEFATKSPEAVLRSLARRFGAGGVLRVRCLFRGLPAHLPQHVFSDLTFIVQEAVANAVKHGKARTVLLSSDPLPDGFALSVTNDGEPFDFFKAPGPEAGHFGLAGMRERASRSGIRLSFKSGRRLTTVRLEVPVS